LYIKDAEEEQKTKGILSIASKPRNFKFATADH
jgi:hypothetical protein